MTQDVLCNPLSFTGALSAISVQVDDMFEVNEAKYIIKI